MIITVSWLIIAGFYFYYTTVQTAAYAVFLLSTVLNVQALFQNDGILFMYKTKR